MTTVDADYFGKKLLREMEGVAEHAEHLAHTLKSWRWRVGVKDKTRV